MYLDANPVGTLLQPVGLASIKDEIDLGIQILVGTVVGCRGVQERARPLPRQNPVAGPPSDIAGRPNDEELSFGIRFRYIAGPTGPQIVAE